MASVEWQQAAALGAMHATQVKSARDVPLQASFTLPLGRTVLTAERCT